MSDASGRAPLVWLLIDDRPGHRTQVVGLANALGWPAVEKTLRFNSLERRPNPLLGATLKTLDDASRASIAPPYPDVVIGMGRRVTPVARWIRRATGGRTRTVMIGRKAGGHDADLTVRCAHFGRPPERQALELVVPPTQVDAATLARVRLAEPDPVAGAAAPRTVMLVGGPTTQHAMTDAFAERTAREVTEAVAATGGSLAIVTSRRTPESVVAALAKGAPEAKLHVWRRDETYNPYLAFLAHADLLVVTGESESMIAEAVAAARPLTVVPMIPKAVKRSRFSAFVEDLSRREGPAGRLGRGLLARGWATPRRDLAILHRKLEENGWARLFDGTLNRTPPAPHDESRLVVSRIAALLAAGPKGGL